MNQLAMDPLIPQFLIESMKDAFSIQVSMAIEAAITAPDDNSMSIDIVAVLGLQSTAFLGSIALCFPASTFLKVVNKMLGEEYPAITDEISDAAGEILNIIYGAARVKLNLNGHDFKPSIPAVVKGNQLSVNNAGNPLRVRIKCTSEAGIFHLEVSLRKAH